MTKMINGIDYSSIGINQNLDVNLSSRASELTAYNIMSLMSSIDNKIPQTINQYKDGTIIITSKPYMDIINGNGYMVSERFESVAPDEVVNICISNPPGSGKTLKLLFLETYSTGKLYLDIFNGTINTTGTALTINNLNLESTNTSLATVEYGGTYTFTNQFLKIVIPGGSYNTACNSAGEITGIIIIPEGKNILLKITNKSASSEDISFRMNWIED